MLRDYSVDLYLARSEERMPDACEELGFVVRARSLEEAMQLTLTAHKNETAWKGWRLLELNAQEIQFIERLKEDFSCVLSGPTTQKLIRNQ